MQSGGFLGRLLGPLLTTGLLLMKSIIQPLAKSVLIFLGLTAAASAADAGTHKKNLGIWPEYNNNHIKRIGKVKSLEDSGLLLEGVS